MEKRTMAVEKFSKRNKKKEFQEQAKKRKNQC
ncbi:Putative uncharacterized protein [Lactococcus lactis subsp. lactis A12]|uniref:Uncharacterized protein n=1 Tax=Lactococcus lactis subsp. lactis A12 TaxID=1137134 RepID=S6FTJ1_LACLL|nr:Putative uncharacterized protein [Lactococcus lactis subsp. lactis A12]